MRLDKMIFHNFLAKIICLILAVVTWFYVFDIISTDSYLKKKETAEDVMARYKFAMKEVPVKPVFTGKSPEGYRVNYDKIIIEPKNISVFLPEELLEDINEVRTESIDIGEYTRSTWLKQGIETDSDTLHFDNQVISVYIPVEAVKKEEEGKK